MSPDLEPLSEAYRSRVLVVDDDRHIAEFISMFLTYKGYDVCVAYSGVEALTKAKEWRPHLMLLDIVMPEMDGMETLRQLREFDEDVCVMMVTGVDDVEMGRRALMLGAVDYITKPLDLDYLEQSVLVKMKALLNDI